MLEQVDKIRIYGMTTLNKKLVDRARKIALMMQSPFENEVIVAASLLKKLLDEHNMTLQELGLKNLKNEDLNRTIVKESATEIKNNNLRDVIRTSEASHEITPAANIKEMLYKHLICDMHVWFLCVLVKIARAYGVWIVGDRYGTWAERSYFLKIVGFSADVEILKIVIVNLRKFIETQILKRGYVDKTQIANYAFGLIDTIINKITEDTARRSTYESRLLSKSKSAKLAEYMYKCYGLTTDCDPIDLGRDDGAYRVGRCDGYQYFKPNSCKEAFSAILKKSAETAMKKVE